MKYFKGSSPTALEANWILLLLTVLFLTVGSIAQSFNIYFGLFFSQIFLMVLPILFFLKNGKYDIGYTIRLNKTEKKNIALMFFVVIFSYPILVLGNFLTTFFVEKFGNTITLPISEVTSIPNLLINIVFVGFLPGICEEFVYRGFLLRSLEGFGKIQANIIQAIVFGLFHFNLQNLIGPIFLGLIYGYITQKTDSLIPAMVGHSLNNIFATFLSFSLRNVEIVEDSLNSQTFLSQLLPVFTLAIISFLILRQIIKKMDKKEDSIIEESFKEEYSFLNILPIFTIFVFYIIFTKLVFFS